MNKHGHFGYLGSTEIVGERSDGSYILSDDSTDDIYPGNCKCEYCESERKLYNETRETEQTHKVSLLQKTLNWFNAQFGTGLEELDCGDPGNPTSCVLAMTLKNHVNPNFNWNVTGSSISISTAQTVNTSVWPDVCSNIYVGDPDDSYQVKAIPLEVGGQCSTIATREDKDYPTLYEDYDSIDTTVQVVKNADFPDYVQEFIKKFDDHEYDQLEIR